MPPANDESRNCRRASGNAPGAAHVRAGISMPVRRHQPVAAVYRLPSGMSNADTRLRTCASLLWPGPIIAACCMTPFSRHRGAGARSQCGKAAVNGACRTRGGASRTRTSRRSTVARAGAGRAGQQRRRCIRRGPLAQDMVFRCRRRIPRRCRKAGTRRCCRLSRLDRGRRRRRAARVARGRASGA